MSTQPHTPRASFLHPGEFHFGPAPGHVGTLLGSCVAVTVWHPASRVGGMCHILLPARKRFPGCPPDGRYADEAIERFVCELASRHIATATCQVHLFGGGNMFSGTPAEQMNIGARNIEATRKALAVSGFSLVSEHVGGVHPRKLYLDLSTGNVRMTLTHA